MKVVQFENEPISFAPKESTSVPSIWWNNGTVAYMKVKSRNLTLEQLAECNECFNLYVSEFVSDWLTPQEEWRGFECNHITEY